MTSSEEVCWKEVAVVVATTAIVALLLSLIPMAVFQALHYSYAEEIRLFSIVFVSIVIGRQSGLFLCKRVFK